MPTLASKVTLVASTAITCSIIGYVHFRQVDDRVQLHKGIEKEAEKKANLDMLRQQKELTEAYKKAEARSDLLASISNK